MRQHGTAPTARSTASSVGFGVKPGLTGTWVIRAACPVDWSVGRHVRSRRPLEAVPPSLFLGARRVQVPEVVFALWRVVVAVARIEVRVYIRHRPPGFIEYR